MGRSLYGNKINGYNGLTETLAPNILRTRNAGKVVKPGRLVSLGAYLGANTAVVANARLAAHLVQMLLSPTAWYKADAITGLTDGAQIASWVDSSGNGLSATQATGIGRPLYRTGLMNGLPVAEFLSSDSLGSPVSGSLITEGFIGVIQRTVTGTIDTILDSSTGGRKFFIQANDTLRLAAEAGTTLGTTVGTIGTLPTLVSFIITPTTWEMSINGFTESGTHAVTFAGGLTTIIGEGPGASNDFAGLMAELMFFNGITHADLQRAEGVLARKYNITLDPTHPYAIIPPVVTFDPLNADPVTLLAESDRIGVNTLWNGNGAGGAVFELPVGIPWHLEELGDWSLWLQSYYQGAATGTIPDATALSSWPQVRPTDPSAVQASAPSQPTLKLAQQNGLDVVRFSTTGTDDEVTIPISSLPFLTAQPFSWAIVWKPANVAAVQDAIWATTSIPSLARNAAGDQQVYAGTNLTQAMAGGQWAVSIAVFNGVNSINMLNGVAVIGNAGSGAATTGNLYIGAGAGILGVNGDIGEIFMDNRAWSIEECQLITQRLAWVWGLTSLLPTGFPYKTAPYLIPGGKLVNAGDEIAVGAHSDGTLRMPANFFLGGHKWEQSTSGLIAPSAMVPTVDTDDDKGLSTYFAVEENRPPVLTPVNPIEGKIVAMGQPTYTFTAADPDRSEGYGDYIKQAIVRVWQRFRGAMYYDSYRKATFSKPQYNDRGAQSFTISTGPMNPPVDFGTRMTTRLAAWENPAQVDNTDLTTWIDDSGNDNNAVQTTAANKPNYRTNIISTLPAIDFDGTNDFMDLAGVAADNLDEAIFILLKPDVLGRSPIGSTINGGRSISISSGGGLQHFKNGTGAIASTAAGLITIGAWHILSIVSTPNMIRLGVNGVVTNVYHTSTLSGGGITVIGAADHGPNTPFDGMIEDIIVMKASELRPGDEERITAYFAHAYLGTTILPATHPYKVSPPGLRVSIPPPNTTNTIRYEGLPAPQIDGQPLTQWNNTGPGGIAPAQQVIPSRYPVWRDPRINGLGAADFDGVDDQLTSTASSSSLDEALFAVINVRSLAASGAIKGTSGAGGTIYYIDGATKTVRINKNTFGDIANSGLIVNLNEWIIVHWILNATSWEMGINGVIVRGTHAQTLTAGLTSLYGAGTTVSTFFNGLIANIVRMPASDLGIDGAARHVGKLAWDYGLQSKLPDDHSYRFESPGADIEHAWTVEVQDEIGGESGTTKYGYDGELPDTTKMGFYTSSTGYSLEDGTGIALPNLALDLNGKSKTSRRTPAYIQPTYQHPLGISTLGLRVRIVKKNAAGEYEQDQVSPWFYTTIAPAASLNYQWWRALFGPLDFGFDYAAEVQYIDTNGIISQWKGRREFHTNYPPNQGAITSPTNPTTVTSPPLVLFSVTDDDDVGVAYYANPEWAIWEAEAGATGAGTSPPQFSAPSQVAITPAGGGIGNVNIADSANGRIMILDANLGFVGVINDPAVGNRGVVVDTSGNIYSADGSNFYIKKYNPAGTLLATSAVIPAAPGFGLRTPWHLALSGTAITLAIAVPDSSNGFTSLAASSLAGGFPTHDGKGDNRTVSVFSIAYGNVMLGEFWAADYGEAFIRLYSGTWVLKDKWGDFDRIRRPVALAIHPDTGNAWIADEFRKTIMEYTRYGDFLGELGPVFTGTGGVKTNMTLPYGLAFNVAGDKFYVTDSFQNKVRRFRVSEVAEKTNAGCAGEIAIKGPLFTAYQSFEDGDVTWAINNSGSFTATGGIASLSPAEGNNYYHIAFTAGPTKPSNTDPVLASYEIHNNNTFPVVEGFSYQVSAKFRRSKIGMYGQVGISWRHETVPSFGLGTSWSSVVRPVINSWTKVSVSDVAPAGATTGTVVLLEGVDVGGLTYPIDIDWDDIQIEDGVRYLRGASFIGADDYSYQLTATDMPTKNKAYTLMARGRDGDNSGDWSDVATIYYVDGPTATIISPTSGQVFTTATPIFLWQLTSGAQWAYKVEVLDTSGIIIYTSDWIQSVNARSHQVPVSAGLTDGGSYIGRLWIDDGNLQVLT